MKRMHDGHADVRSCDGPRITLSQDGQATHNVATQPCFMKQQLAIHLYAQKVAACRAHYTVPVALVALFEATSLESLVEKRTSICLPQQLIIVTESTALGRGREAKRVH
jgi:hypothetical protein